LFQDLFSAARVEMMSAALYQSCQVTTYVSRWFSTYRFRRRCYWWCDQCLV